MDLQTSFTILFIILCGQQHHASEHVIESVPALKENNKYGLDLIKIQKQKNFEEYDIYNDVLSHSLEKPFGDNHGRYTNVHETAHGIHNQLRKIYKPLFKKSVNGFYCLNGQCAIVEDPNIKIRHVQKYIPDVLKSSRYKLYLVEQLQYWDDVPTYILDEWNCYVLGAECAVDDAKRKRDLEKTNAVSGALEFSVYATALAMAVKNHDPLFWETNSQFKAFIKYNLLRSERAFSAGAGVPEFANKEQDRLQQTLLNHPDAEPIREFLKNEFDGIFVD
jgi:hypothetical protein